MIMLLFLCDNLTLKRRSRLQYPLRNDRFIGTVGHGVNDEFKRHRIVRLIANLLDTIATPGTQTDSHR
jgi:hypothetical protein